jgi:Family of unknown function (DUF6186)
MDTGDPALVAARPPGGPDVIATIAWLALAGVGLAWELVCRRTRGRWASLGTIGSALGSRLPGRMALLALWGFVGWHLFARYTLPR